MCTSFAIYSQEKVIYGMNFDTNEIDLKLKLYSSKGKNIFYFSGLLGDTYRNIAGINSDGLFICTQAVEYNSETRVSYNENDWFIFDIFDEALTNTSKTSDFHKILNNRLVTYPRNPLFPDLGLHTIIADKTGDAFIIEEGINGNRINSIDNNFIVMTNFPNGDFDGISYDKVTGCGADRYINAYEYINNNIRNLGVNEAFDILRENSREDTLCTIVFEPLKNEIYISFKKDLSKKWKISITEKTIQSLDGVFSNNKIQFTNEETLVKDLVSLY